MEILLSISKKTKNLLLRTSLLMMLCMLVFQENASAQGYEEAVTKDSIKISYKWRKYKIFRKNSPEVLMLKVENLRKTKVSVSFRILFHWKATLHSKSSSKFFCLRPGQKIKGKKWELAFHSQDFTKEDYSNPFFSWYVDELKVEENQDCKPGLKLKLVPSYPDKPDVSIEPIITK